MDSSRAEARRRHGPYSLRESQRQRQRGRAKAVTPVREREAAIAAPVHRQARERDQRRAEAARSLGAVIASWGIEGCTYSLVVLRNSSSRYTPPA